MIETNLYCKASGMVMSCIVDFQNTNNCMPIVCEIGCAEGQGVAHYAGFCKQVISIDAMETGRPDITSFEKEDIKIDSDKVDEFTTNTGREGFNVNLVIGSSSWKETVDKVEKLLDGRQIDILLIDGAHHPASVIIKDFELYSPLVERNGYIIFDDTYESDVMEAVNLAIENGWEVYKEWKIKTPKILQALKVLKRK